MPSWGCASGGAPTTAPCAGGVAGVAGAACVACASGAKCAAGVVAKVVGAGTTAPTGVAPWTEADASAAEAEADNAGSAAAADGVSAAGKCAGANAAAEAGRYAGGVVNGTNGVATGADTWAGAAATAGISPRPGLSHTAMAAPPLPRPIASTEKTRWRLKQRGPKTGGETPEPSNKRRRSPPTSMQAVRTSKWTRRPRGPPAAGIFGSRATWRTCAPGNATARSASAISAARAVSAVSVKVADARPGPAHMAPWRCTQRATRRAEVCS